MICGATENLQFDHIDPNSRLFFIGRDAGRRNSESFWIEVSKCQLLCFLHHIEKTIRDGTYRGEGNGRAKLTENEVEHIRDLYASGQYFQRTIAEMFGVHQATISKIVLKQRWN